MTISSGDATPSQPSVESVFQCDVSVLTHPRTAHYGGGTTFHFVSDGIDSAVKRARTTAKDKDVRGGGGVATVRAFLQAGLAD